VDPERYIELYTRAGYDFISITDHGVLTLPEGEGIILVPGMEWNSEAGEHTGIYALNTGTIETARKFTKQKELLQYLATRDCLAILNHPNWQDTPHYRREELAARAGFDGTEIYNHVIEYLDGEALATEKWDYLLSRDIRVLGLAGDDAHRETGVGKTWNMVRAGERSAKAIYQALQTGNFYASSGVVISDIRKEGETITLETENAQEIHAIGNNGRRLGIAEGKAMVFGVPHIPEEQRAIITYIRFTAYGPGTQMAWTQPFFINGGK
jgi:hypothetical protein